MARIVPRQFSVQRAGTWGGAKLDAEPSAKEFYRGANLLYNFAAPDLEKRDSRAVFGGIRHPPPAEKLACQLHR